ncbi:MAG: hypothetical protein FJ299_04750 [Planctomycetes bacterium]|nr:hypothetical protein [Planctomycetota bacterium]
MKLLPILATPALLLAIGARPAAQANQVAGRDVQLFSLSALTAMGRTGTFPSGLNGLAMSTTSCNTGVGNLPWNQAMAATHPMISFIVARREVGDTRITQISDRSFIKHGFFATNSGGCGSCQSPGTGSQLGPGCSDTYGTTNNGDNFWLGPADEFNPWLGTWNPVCSHFDKGEPPVAPAQQCDGLRSLTTSQATALGPVGHRINVTDAALNTAAAGWVYQSQYNVIGEPEIERDNNTAWRPFTPTWSAGQNKWNFTTGSGTNYNSILTAWPGAIVADVLNGGDDGRVHVAYKVTGPVNGVYHYEYAIHNRDNHRGIDAFRLPVCANARILAVGFQDIDLNAGNDWTFANNGTELVWSTSNNPLNWNSFYNFWFDSDAAPQIAPALLDQDKAGTGLAQLSVNVRAPLTVYNEYLGAGCSLDATPPVLFATGSPANAAIPNASFGFQSTGNAIVSPVTLFYGGLPGTLNLGGSCNLYMGGWLGTGITIWGSAVSDAVGTASFAVPVPNDAGLEGLEFRFQSLGFNLGGAPLFDLFDLSNGLNVRVGNAIPACAP